MPTINANGWRALNRRILSNPEGQKYGYGIALITFGPNKVYFHGGEMPGYNSFMGHDPDNDVTLIIWTNLTRVARWHANSQHSHAENAGPDLYSVTT